MKLQMSIEFLISSFIIADLIRKICNKLLLTAETKLRKGIKKTPRISKLREKSESKDLSKKWVYRKTNMKFGKKF